jgi:DNA-binding NtrC family response regulator
MEEDCVLIIEHDTLVRHPLAEYLRDCGYRVLEAVNYGEARALLDDASLRIDVVLADIRAPEQEGFLFSSWLRRAHPHVELLLSGTVGKIAQNAEEICEEGPAPTKPPDHHAVLDRIRRALAARARWRSGKRDEP